MNRRHLRLFRLGLGALLTVLAFGPASSARADLRVVATLADLAAVAKAVGGDAVTVEALAAPTEDPHYVDPRPSFLPRLARADVLIAVGLQLEIGWLPPLLVNARNTAIQVGGSGYVDASSFVRHKLQVPTTKVDRSMGDVHPGGNPHFHTAPGPMQDVVLGLGETFARLDAKNADGYRARAKAFAARLKALADKTAARFSTLPEAKRRIVVFHDSFEYLAQWLGLDQVTTIEERPGIRPSPARVAAVMGVMRAKAARVILQETWHLDGVSRMLAQKAPGTLVKVTGGTKTLTGEAYLAYLEGLAAAIFDALQ